MKKRRRPTASSVRKLDHGPTTPTTVRIIGGQFRGRRLKYSGDPRTRPMKDRVREAVFNLVRDRIEGRVAIDLFAGTGALGLEALSRGAQHALLIERHGPTARLIRENAQLLGVDSQVTVVATDTLAWSRSHPVLAQGPWLIFCSPPFDLYLERSSDMTALIADLCNRAPAGSAIVVESDERFDLTTLPEPDDWDIRPYPPAVVAVWRCNR